MTETIAAKGPYFMLETGGSFGTRGNYAPELLRVPSSGVFFSKEDRAARLSAWPKVEESIRAFKPDILHINTEFIIADFGFRYGKKHRVPIVYTFHTIWEDYAANYFPLIPDFLLRFGIRKFLKALLKKSDLIIVPTVQIEEMIKAYKVKKETRLLPTGVDPALFRHSAEEAAAFRKRLEEKYPELEGKRILMFAGRVAKEKNIGFIIAMMKNLIEKHHDLVLLIAGNGPDLDYYREEALSCGAGGHCVFTGYLERSELALCYAVSEVFVFPSLTETQGLVTIEAMLSGIPVVAIGVLGDCGSYGRGQRRFYGKKRPE
jgi:glycosyltransferase involved in cell wall biosynthesis